MAPMCPRQIQWWSTLRQPGYTTLSRDLEQVHVRGFIRRGLRLQLVAGLTMVAVLPALAQSPQHTPRVATQTSLAVDAHDQAGRTRVALAVAVATDDDASATGAVEIRDNGKPLAGAGLNAQGHAALVLDLPTGEHSFKAIYTGDASHIRSVSEFKGVHALATTSADFQISVAPASLSLTAGQSGSVIASITPENSAALTAPMFVTLSCSGLPDQSSCAFTPENLEILPNATNPLTSSIVIQTQQQEGSIAHPGANGVALAVLLPGAFGLGLLAWSVRRRPWLQRLSLIALLALVATMGTTACDARYNYYNHGPPINPATPSGTYTRACHRAIQQWRHCHHPQHRPGLHRRNSRRSSKHSRPHPFVTFLANGREAANPDRPSIRHARFIHL